MSQSQFAWGICFLLSLILCPLYPAVINRTKAFFAGRHGPRFLQVYYDIYKLLRKGSVYSRTATDLLRLAPMAVLGTLLTAALLLPFGMAEAPLAFSGDIILFFYLLAFARAMMVLGALDTGSSFEGMGASREMQFSVFTEGAVFCILAFLVLLTGRLHLTGVLNGFDVDAWIVSGTSMLFVAAAFFIVMLSESCRMPFDDPETHLELTMIHEAMILDYGGPDLGIILYSSSLKLWMLSSFFVMLVLPVSSGDILSNILAYFSGMTLTAVGIGVLESILARFRFLKVPQMLIGAFCIALAGIILMLVFEGGIQ
ncbi:MAG: Hydrogenase-4 component C [Lentisphaerae bacterium ADurb.Bin242]|nr:MAG: Hydrogenase-4 component C [Lentisphaerae bacterium ADurb.Bin242]